MSARAPTPAADEVRALWVFRTSLVSPERVRAVVADAAGAGFNTLIVQVRGRGDAFYRSSVEPRSESLWDQPATFDPLALALDEAHVRGLRVHAWLNTFLVWDTPLLYPADATHIVRARPDLLAVPRALAAELYALSPQDSTYVQALLRHALGHPELVDGLYASPSAAAVHEHTQRLAVELAERYPVDGVHFDYVRYPDAEYDYSASTLKAFRAWAAPRVREGRARELDELARRDPTAWTRTLPREWDTFRRDAVTTFVREASARLRAARPGLTVSAAVFPDVEQARAERFQAWGDWMDDDLLDLVAPMAYTPDDATFRNQIRAAADEVGGRRVWAGVGAWQNSFEGTVSKIEIARRARVAGFSLFSYDWASDQPGDAAGATWLEALSRRVFAR